MRLHLFPDSDATGGSGDKNSDKSDSNTDKAEEKSAEKPGEKEASKGDSEKKTEDSKKGADGESKFTRADIDRAVSLAAEKWKADQEERLERERKVAEEEKLRETGKHKELADKYKQERDELEAKVKRAEFREKADEKLREVGMTDFLDLILMPADSIDDVAKKSEFLKSRIEREVEKRVQEALDTGRRPSKGGPGAVRLADLKTDKQKADYIDEFGQESFEALVFAESGTPK